MSSEPARRSEQSGQFLLETCLLRTLCLTVNSDGSELKYQILDGLKDEDFYFPVMRTIFSAVTELHRDGDQVVAASLQEVLRQRAIDLPDDFYVEDLFRGELPSMAAVSGWIERLRSGVQAGDPSATMAAPSSASQPSPTLQRTHPSVEVPSEVAPVEAPAAAPPPPSPSKRPPPPAPPPVSTYGAESEPASPPSAEAKERPKAEVKERPKVETKERPKAEAKVETKERPKVENEVLTPESGHWLGFLAELTRKQGWHLKTGFSQFDAASGGLAPGLCLLAGEDREQLVDFLKQLVDQIAVVSKGPCLYLSFERTKALLRLQTLSRLSGAPTADIEKGRFAKESPKWQDIVRAGEHAVDWLQRIYVVEPRPGLAVTRIRELRQQLLDSGAGAPPVIAIDNLEKLANESDLLHSVAELKELAEALEVVVVGAVTAMEIVHERSAHLAGTFHGEDGATVVKLTTAGSTAPTVLRFQHRREIHRFEERASV